MVPCHYYPPSELGGGGRKVRQEHEGTGRRKKRGGRVAAWDTEEVEGELGRMHMDTAHESAIPKEFRTNTVKKKVTEGEKDSCICKDKAQAVRPAGQEDPREQTRLSASGLVH